MKSLRVRLDPIREEVLDYTKRHGRSPAMDKFGVRDYVCFANWLEEVTDDPFFGFEAACRNNGNMPLLDALLERFLFKVAKLEAEVKRLKLENEMLREDRDQRQEIQEAQILAVIQACEV